MDDGDEEETGLDSLVSCETFEDSLLLSLHTFLFFFCFCFGSRTREKKEKANLKRRDKRSQTSHLIMHTHVYIVV